MNAGELESARDGICPWLMMVKLPILMDVIVWDVLLFLRFVLVVSDETGSREVKLYLAFISMYTTVYWFCFLRKTLYLSSDWLMFPFLWWNGRIFWYYVQGLDCRWPYFWLFLLLKGKAWSRSLILIKIRGKNCRCLFLLNRDHLFTSTFQQELFSLQGTKLRMSFFYHPKFDGQTKVIN